MHFDITRGSVALQQPSLTPSSPGFFAMRTMLNAHSEFAIVLALFLAFRLMSLLLTTPSSPLTAGYTDNLYYYQVAQLSDRGYFPYIDYWFEYPPVFTYIAIGVYKLTSWTHRDIEYFSQTLAIILLPFELLTLICLYLIALRLYGPSTAVRLSWVYTALFLPFFFWRYSFDTMVAALTMLAFYGLLAERKIISAIALGFAIGTKLIPAFLLGTVWRFASKPRKALGYTLVVVATLTAIFGYFLVRSPLFVAASFESLAARSSYDTIWAVADGNYGYGDMGSLARHFDSSQAPLPIHNPSVLPWWLTSLAFGAIFLFVCSLPIDRANPRSLLLFTGISLMLFDLWSKGWSPQWITLVLPFVLLLYPKWRGILLALTLSFSTLMDWPLAFAYQNRSLFVAGIVLRTALLVFIFFDLLGELIRSGRVTKGAKLHLTLFSQARRMVKVLRLD
jgi:hypothetical protein